MWCVWDVSSGSNRTMDGTQLVGGGVTMGGRGECVGREAGEREGEGDREKEW